MVQAGVQLKNQRRGLTIMYCVESLDQHSSGSVLDIAEIDASDSIRHKLYSMGLMPGNSIKIISGSYNHPYLLQTSVSRIILDYTTVKMIKVYKQ